MRAVRVGPSLAGPDGLTVEDVAEPEAEPGGLVLDVAAAGVSFPDLLLSRGEYQLKPPPPFTLGVEAAGTVRAVGEGVSGFAVGDRVMGFGLGTWAERAWLPAAGCFTVPDGLDLVQAAGFVMNHHTAWFALALRARVAAGETVLVQGAAGGTGTAAIQVALALGATPVAVVSTQDKGETARAAGAAEVVLTEGDWKARVLELSDGGVDVVFDPVGGERFHESLRCLRPDGRLVVIGFTEGSIPEVKVNRLLFRNVAVVGAAWGAYVAVRPEVVAEGAAALERMVADGHVRPLVGQRFALADAAEALRCLDGRAARGKVVLEVA